MEITNKDYPNTPHIIAGDFNEKFEKVDKIM